MSKRLLIVAHAPSENTLSLRGAVERGALSETGIDLSMARSRLNCAIFTPAGFKASS